MIIDRKRRCGVVTVEFALSLLILFLVVLPAVQLGLYFVDRSGANVAAFYAARAYAQSGDESLALDAARQEWEARGEDGDRISIEVVLSNSVEIGTECVVDVEAVADFLGFPLTTEMFTGLTDGRDTAVTLRTRARSVLEEGVVPQ